MFRGKKEPTSFSSEIKLTDDEAIEKINAKLHKNQIKSAKPLESWQYSEEAWQNIESLITEFDCHRILDKEKAAMIFQYHSSLRYLVDEFYRADHTYHYSQKFHLSKAAHAKSFYWLRERKFIDILFEYQHILPLLAAAIQQQPYDSETILKPEFLNELIKGIEKAECRLHGMS